MSYSDIVGTISGVLQFVVACYALRVSRIYGIARVGWLFFGAFSLLALVHVALSVQPFGLKLELGPGVNVLYEIISVLLLGNIAQMEAMLWRRRRKLQANAKSVSDGETKANQQVTELTRAKEASQQTAAQLQAELVQLTQAFQQEKQSHEQERFAHQQEKQAYEQEKQAFEQEKLAHAQAALAQATRATEAEKNFQEQVAAGRKAEEELRTIAASLQSELAQQKQLHDQEKEAYEAATKTYEELITAARQSEEELQTTINALQTELAARAALAPEQPKTSPAPEPLPPVTAPAPIAPEREPVRVDHATRDYEELLHAARQSEEELRSTIVDLEAELTEQKRKQEQNESAYRELLTSLRESGIAEVASLAQSRIGYIARITNLMREHSRDIGKFMTRHPRGKQLPNALSLMIEYLSDEQYLLVKRIDSVKSKLAKISETAVERTSGPDVPSEIPTNAELPAESHDEPAPPVERVPAAAPADFLSHVIENVTETGTESTPSEELPADGDAPLLLPDLGDFKGNT